MENFEHDEALCIYDLQQWLAHDTSTLVKHLIADYIPQKQYTHTDVLTINYTGGTSNLELKRRNPDKQDRIKQKGVFIEVDKVRHGTQIYVNFINDWKYVSLMFIPPIKHLIDQMWPQNVWCTNANRYEPKYTLPLSWGYTYEWDGTRYIITKPDKSNWSECPRLKPNEGYDADAWAELRKSRLVELSKYDNRIIIN